MLLFVMAMSSYLGAGNDLLDNLEEASQTGRPAKSGDGASIFELARSHLREASNLVRLILYVAGPTIRAKMLPAASDDQVQRALQITGEQLGRLDDLGRRYGFRPEIYLIPPASDIVRGTHWKTLQDLRSVYGGGITSLEPLLQGESASYYFPMDKHLNRHGNQVIADYLVWASRAFPDTRPSLH